jgi:hypothetical protein
VTCPHAIANEETLMRRLLQGALVWLLFGAANPALAAGPDPTDDPKYCGSCHQRIYQEYAKSVMGTDLANPIVYQFFTATNGKGEKDGLGYQGIFPGQPGDCAQCHVPKLVLKEHAAGREVDLGHAIREKLDHGISCSYCHSVQHVAVKEQGGRFKTGPVNTVTLDPSGAMHGPRPGVRSPAHPVKVDPFIRSAEFCSQCHLNQEEGHAKTRNEGKGVLAISTYQDWKQLYDSGRIRQTCVDCHMPLLPGKQEVALQSPKRANTRAHTFVGAHDPEILRESVTLDLQTRIEGDSLIVSTVVENVGAGHNIPGSGPIRAVMLKVEAWDADGRALSYVGGPDGLLHPLAGMGHPKTGERGPQHWGGMPGRLYAKPLQTPPDPATGKPRLGVGGFAAERIAFDTTLKYRQPDRAEFRFRLPAGSQPVKVQAKLVYRWAFIGLADAKGWKVEDRLMRVALREVPRS